jgi:2-oxoglutarate dehydrogenase E1 component
LTAEIARFKNAELFWCQEEPENMGAWSFLEPRINGLISEAGRNMHIRYIGRRVAASPAAGYLKIHEREQKQVIEDALGGGEKTALKKAAG